MSVFWNPWHGCRKISEGCEHCYVYSRDRMYGKDSSVVSKTANFGLPLKRKRDGNYKIASEETVLTCFTSDFLLSDADSWRPEAWRMIRERHDLDFFFITKRIDRFMVGLPDDWGDGYDNVAVGCTVENMRMADYRLRIFRQLPIKHRIIICAPLIEPLDLSHYLDRNVIEQVSAGGESGAEARVCDYDWVLGIRTQCMAAGVPFSFHQTGARLLKDGRIYDIERRYQHSQAKRAGIDVGTVRLREG